jgi:hypothetical protein
MGLCARRPCRTVLAETEEDGTIRTLSPLFKAIQARNISAVKLLLEKRGLATHLAHTADEQDPPPGCPLLLAARTPGYIISQEIAILLVRHGVPLGSRDDSGRNALDWAILLQNEDLVHYLLAAGAKPSRHPGPNVRATMQTLLQSYLLLPLSLMQIARRSIRDHCFRSCSDALNPMEDLRLPRRLQQYLTLEIL